MCYYVEILDSNNNKVDSDWFDSKEEALAFLNQKQSQGFQGWYTYCAD